MAKSGALLSTKSFPFLGDAKTVTEIFKGAGKTLNHFAKGEVGLGIQRLTLVGGRVALEASDLGGFGEMVRPAAVAVLRAGDRHLDRKTAAHRLPAGSLVEANRNFSHAPTAAAAELVRAT